MRPIFLGIFVISFILTISLTIIGERYLAAIPLHLTLSSFSMFFLYGKNLNETIKKLGIFTRPLEQIGYGIVGFIMLVALTILLNIILYYANFDDGYKIADTVKDFPFYLLVFAILFAPISEELFFRVLLVEKIESYFSSLLAKTQMPKLLPAALGIFSSSVLFALAHLVYGSIAQLIGAFIIGIFLALLYRYSKSIVPLLIAHLLFNLTSLIIIKILLGT